MDGDRSIADPAERASYLGDKLLKRKTTEEDVPDPWAEDLPLNKNIYWNPNVTEAEAKKATTRSGNTAPGADGISVALLQLAWPAVGDYITNLFRGCLQAGHHPLPFQSAEVTIIPKPGKPEKAYTTHKGYRPISLLSCIGKGLERLLARRIALLALEHKILPEHYFGALPKRSATDLVACLVHDIEIALAKGWVVTLLLLDIAGAFDIVMRNRLILRLRRQGWPPPFIKWVDSFMSDRLALVRDGTGSTLPSTRLECGAPQGSPISPILAMLYFCPILKLNDPDKRFGYADDVAIMAVGRDTRETSRMLQWELDDTLKWGRENAISFDPDKAELVHFHYTRGKDHPEGVDFEGTPILPQESVRWLGVHLDPRLSFRKHVEVMTGKALKTANFLKSLNKTRKGSPPDAVAMAAKACVLPVALYGLEAWWPGETRQSRNDPSKLISTGATNLIVKMDKPFRTAARASVPVWRTTNMAVIHRESGFPRATLALAQARLRAATRFACLDRNHPISRRIDRKLKGTPMTRLQRTASLVGRTVRPSLFAHNIGSVLPGTDLRGTSKDEAATKHLEILENLPSTTLVAYSDGSQDECGNTGWGAVTFHNARATSSCGNLPNAEVYDAEAVGAFEALKLAKTRIRSNPDIKELILFLDNSAVVDGILGTTPASSQNAYMGLRRIAKEILPEVITRVAWVPGHKDIHGNETADALAKRGSELPRPPTQYYTITNLRRRAKEGKKELRELDWESNRPGYYNRWRLDALPKPPELQLPRPILHRLLAERSGHRDFAEYHKRFGHDTVPLCKCGDPKTQGHFAECRMVEPFLPEVPERDLREGYNALTYLLGPNRYKHFQILVEDTSPYGTIPQNLD